jgi:uncharacterized spore protein YtfJ
MSKPIEIISENIPNQERANDLLEKLIDAGQSKAVFSEPVEAGEYKVITAAEVSVGLGFGYGGGGGYGDMSGSDDSAAKEDGEPTVGLGAGGGGGGASVSRPVAAIEIGPHGVRVEPIIDPTKVVVAFFTTLVSMFAMMGRMRRIRKRGI